MNENYDPNDPFELPQNETGTVKARSNSLSLAVGVDVGVGVGVHGGRQQLAMGLRVAGLGAGDENGNGDGLATVTGKGKPRMRGPSAGANRAAVRAVASESWDDDFLFQHSSTSSLALALDSSSISPPPSSFLGSSGSQTRSSSTHSHSKTTPSTSYTNPSLNHLPRTAPNSPSRNLPRPGLGYESNSTTPIQMRGQAQQYLQTKQSGYSLVSTEFDEEDRTITLEGDTGRRVETPSPVHSKVQGRRSDDHWNLDAGGSEEVSNTPLSNSKGTGSRWKRALGLRSGNPPALGPTCTLTSTSSSSAGTGTSGMFTGSGRRTGREIIVVPASNPGSTSPASGKRDGEFVVLGRRRSSVGSAAFQQERGAERQREREREQDQDNVTPLPSPKDKRRPSLQLTRPTPPLPHPPTSSPHPSSILLQQYSTASTSTSASSLSLRLPPLPNSHAHSPGEFEQRREYDSTTSADETCTSDDLSSSDDDGPRPDLPRRNVITPSTSFAGTVTSKRTGDGSVSKAKGGNELVGIALGGTHGRTGLAEVQGRWAESQLSFASTAGAFGLNTVEGQEEEEEGGRTSGSGKKKRRRLFKKRRESVPGSMGTPDGGGKRSGFMVIRQSTPQTQAKELSDSSTGLRRGLSRITLASSSTNTFRASLVSGEGADGGGGMAFARDSGGEGTTKKSRRMTTTNTNGNGTVGANSSALEPVPKRSTSLRNLRGEVVQLEQDWLGVIPFAPSPTPSPSPSSIPLPSTSPSPALGSPSINDRSKSPSSKLFKSASLLRKKSLKSSSSGTTSPTLPSTPTPTPSAPSEISTSKSHPPITSKTQSQLSTRRPMSLSGMLSRSASSLPLVGQKRAPSPAPPSSPPPVPSTPLTPRRKPSTKDVRPKVEASPNTSEKKLHRHSASVTELGKSKVDSFLSRARAFSKSSGNNKSNQTSPESSVYSLGGEGGGYSPRRRKSLDGKKVLLESELMPPPPIPPPPPVGLRGLRNHPPKQFDVREKGWKLDRPKSAASQVSLESSTSTVRPLGGYTQQSGNVFDFSGGIRGNRILLTPSPTPSLTRRSTRQQQGHRPSLSLSSAGPTPSLPSLPAPIRTDSPSPEIDRPRTAIPVVEGRPMSSYFELEQSGSGNQDWNAGFSRRNSLSDLKIPQRITSSQARIEEDLERVKQFAKGIDSLKALREQYEHLILDVVSPSESILSPQRKILIDYAPWWEQAEALVDLGDGKPRAVEPRESPGVVASKRDRCVSLAPQSPRKSNGDAEDQWEKDAGVDTSVVIMNSWRRRGPKATLEKVDGNVVKRSPSASSVETASLSVEERQLEMLRGVLTSSNKGASLPSRRFDANNTRPSLAVITKPNYLHPARQASLPSSSLGSPMAPPSKSPSYSGDLSASSVTSPTSTPRQSDAGGIRRVSRAGVSGIKDFLMRLRLKASEEQARPTFLPPLPHPLPPNYRGQIWRGPPPPVSPSTPPSRTLHSPISVPLTPTRRSVSDPPTRVSSSTGGSSSEEEDWDNEVPSSPEQSPQSARFEVGSRNVDNAAVNARRNLRRSRTQSTTIGGVAGSGGDRMILTTEAMPSLLLKVKEVSERCEECIGRLREFEVASG